MKKIAILVENAYQDLEVWCPLLRMREAGFEVVAVGTGSAMEYKGKFSYPTICRSGALKRILLTYHPFSAIM